ncbi:hypothetical protein [Sinomonas albida]|uniref:hypothetical protein n=1 Tax=Sinomonas albida TaxID=369942 RepID=UPI0010A82143|nr:hypothetical protein [Sinomonas albida]
MAQHQTGTTKFGGKSSTVQAFLSVHARLTEAIHAMCAAQGPDALKNHAADALECLLGSDAASPGPLDHLLGLRIQEHISLFGPMTFVKAVAAEYEIDVSAKDSTTATSQITRTETN